MPFQNLVADYGYQVSAFKQSYEALHHYKFEKGDYFVFARQFPADIDDEIGIRFAEFLKHKGVKIVMDLDDYWELYEGHQIADKWDRSKAELVERSLKLADMVTTTNERLASKIRKHNKNVHVLPNAINLNDPQWQVKSKDWDGVRFGYFGGNTHQKDLEVMQTDMSQYNSYCAVKEHQEFGFKHNLGIKPIQEYATLYDTVNVALAPLVGNKFNNRKSNLKIIEAGFKKCCVVASNVLTYTQLEFKDVVLYVDNNKPFKDVLDYLKRNKKEVVERGEALYEIVQKHYSIKTLNLKRNKIFEK